MKTRILALFVVICFVSISSYGQSPSYSQSPQKLNYQAVLRDVSGNPIQNSNVAVKLSVLQGSSTGTAVCIEEFSPTTNEYGIITLEVGSSNTVDFEAIDWSGGPYYIKVELDEAGGTNYTEMGVSQLISVPYALHAKTAEGLSGNFVWENTGSDIYYNSGNVGIGTTNPLHKFDVRTAANVQVVTDNDVFISNMFSYHDNGLLVHTGYGDGIDIARFSSIGFGYIEVPRFVVKDNGYIGIGTTAPGARLDVANNDLSTTLGSRVNWFRLNGSSGNSDNLYFFQRRHIAGTSWNSSEIVIQKQIDATPMHYISFKGLPSNNSMMEFGYGSSPFMAIDKFGRIGVGTSTPSSKLQVETNSTWSDETPLFEVKNNDGISVFAVYNNGVRIIIEDDPLSKASKGGFAIGGFDPTKGGETVDFMRITPDSIRFSINNDNTKASKGGFAIGGFDRTKGVINEDFMYITPGYSASGQYNSFFGYHAGNSNLSSGIRNTFMGYEAGLSNTYGDYNVFIGNNAGRANTSQGYNVYIGESSGMKNKGDFNAFVGRSTGSEGTDIDWSTLIGFGAGASLTADYNTIIGTWAGPSLTTGAGNIIIGTFAGWSNVSGKENVIIGTSAGETVTGSGNILIGYEAAQNLGAISNQLFIDNWGTSNPLIWGDFSANDVVINGDIFVTGNIYRKVDASQGWHRLDDEDGNDNAYWFISTVQPSDSRLKSDIETIPDALSKISQMRGVRFNWSEEGIDYFTANVIARKGPSSSEEEDMNLENEIREKYAKKLGHRNVGLIAQEVKEVIPEAVFENKDGYLEVAYGNLVGVMLEAIKEQQQQIEELQVRADEIDELRDQIAQLQQMLRAMME